MLPLMEENKKTTETGDLNTLANVSVINGGTVKPCKKHQQKG
jgi:hypothetical protein